MRILISFDNTKVFENEVFIPTICASILHFHSLWMIPAYFMSFTAIMFRLHFNLTFFAFGILPIIRFAMIKYADRGLVNDPFFYNSTKLLKTLFWTANLIPVLLNQGFMWSHYAKHGESFFTDIPVNIVCKSPYSTTISSSIQINRPLRSNVI